MLVQIFVHELGFSLITSIIASNAASLTIIIVSTAQIKASQAAFQLEVQRLDSMDPSKVKNLHLFNITADPYEETDLSHFS